MSEFILAAFADEAGKAVSEQISAMVDNGIKYLEVRGVGEKNIVDLTIDEAKELKKQLADSGLGTWSIGSPIGKININDEFEPHIEKFKHVLELANTLEAGSIRMFSFFMPKDEDPTPYRNKVIEQLSVLTEIAKGTGVDLCHENEKGIYGDIAVRCLDILKNVPGLKAVFDPANFVQSGQETLEAWDMLHDYVKYMHIKDAVLAGDVVPAGTGEGKIPQLLPLYAAQGGKILTMEPHLFEFAGLAGLEQEGERSVVGALSFSSQRGAFDYAVDALKKIIG
ncbi:MAG: sugar phosphate isomerase/epimerase [Clostridia bacterium]|nr:sugar phosphate isomerase/epimerase [Clostridia bacterium]